MVQENETKRGGLISPDLRSETSQRPYPHIPQDHLGLLVRIGLSPNALARLDEGYGNLERIFDPGQREYRATQLRIDELEAILVATLNRKDAIIGEMGSEVAALKKQMEGLQAEIRTLEEELEGVEKRADSLDSVV